MQKTTEIEHHRILARCTCGGEVHVHYERGRFTDPNGGREMICNDCGLVWNHPPSTNWAPLDEVYHTFDRAYKELVAQGITRPNAQTMCNVVQLMLGKSVHWAGVDLHKLGYDIERGVIVKRK